MPLEISEDLVSLAYQSLGYFVTEGRRVGHNEIDLLAVRLGGAGEVVERLHIEVQISTNPIGVLSGKSGDLTASGDPDAGAREWVQRKYQACHLKQVITGIFGDHCYQCVFVHGEMKEPRQLGVIESCGVKCISLGDLVAQAVSACERDRNHNRLHRATEIARLLATP